MNDVRDSPSRGSAGSLLEGDGHLYTNGLHCTGVLSNLNQYRKVRKGQAMSQFDCSNCIQVEQKLKKHGTSLIC